MCTVNLTLMFHVFDVEKFDVTKNNDENLMLKILLSTKRWTRVYDSNNQNYQYEMHLMNQRKTLWQIAISIENSPIYSTFN